MTLETEDIVITIILIFVSSYEIFDGFEGLLRFLGVLGVL
jgi:hypothetical protein